ncbi:hypothetical protein GGR74_000839 [Xanthomonas arboricola]
MEDHWEIGVVTAFRDAQWILKNPNSKVPGLNLGLSGNTEGPVGDALASLGGRYYIFEFKSDQSKCSDEWDSKGWAKDAHVKLMSLCRSIEAAPYDYDLRKLLKYSLRCHHFLYWGEPSLGELGILEQLYFEPYLLYSLSETVLDDASPAECGVKRPGGAFKLSVFRDYYCAIAEASHQVRKCPLTLSDLANKKAEFFSAGRSGYNPLAFGLSIKEFQVYIDFLCNSGKNVDEALKVLIWSERGFFRVVKRTSQLAQVLEEISSGRFSPTVGRPATQRKFSSK